MDKERLDHLWEVLSSATNIKNLRYDEAVTIGSVFGELRAEIKRQLQELERLKGQMNEFEYLASIEYSWQIDNEKNSRSLFHKGALDAMKNYNRKWQEATGREIKEKW